LEQFFNAMSNLTNLFIHNIIL